MKKIIMLVAAAAGVAWAVGKSKATQGPAHTAAKPADPWAQASDRV
jgi:hypothetical protein